MKSQHAALAALGCRLFGHRWANDADQCYRCGVTGMELWAEPPKPPAYWEGYKAARAITISLDRGRAYRIGKRRGARQVLAELEWHSSERGGG